MKKIAIVDERADISIKKALENLGLDLIENKKHKNLYESISSHPDMVMTLVGKDKLVIEGTCFSYYQRLLSKRGLELIRGESLLGSKYPETSRYNLFTLGQYAFHNFKYTDKNLLKVLKKEGYKLVNINQSYAKCSTIILDDKHIITVDRLIDLRARELGIESLLVDNGQVELSGHKYGFIGGASGILGDKLLLTGPIKEHTSYPEIKNFTSKLGIEIVILSDKKLVDIGSIIIV